MGWMRRRKVNTAGFLMLVILAWGALWIGELVFPGNSGLAGESSEIPSDIDSVDRTGEAVQKDLEIRIDKEFSQVDVEMTSLKDRTLQGLLVVGVAAFVIGGLVTRLVFRSAIQGVGLQMS